MTTALESEEEETREALERESVARWLESGAADGLDPQEVAAAVRCGEHHRGIIGGKS